MKALILKKSPCTDFFLRKQMAKLFFSSRSNVISRVKAIPIPAGRSFRQRHCIPPTASLPPSLTNIESHFSQQRRAFRPITFFTSFFPFLFSHSSVQYRRSSGHENDEEDEEEDEDPEHLDHEPPVGGDALEVLEDLPVSGLHVHSCVVNVRVDADLEGETSLLMCLKVGLLRSL